MNKEMWKKIGQQVLVTGLTVLAVLYLKEKVTDKVVAKIGK